jgi:sterol desaturase/sphingolipid hydroxylase (fatty acid hydroxylase superfamily)
MNELQMLAMSYVFFLGLVGGEVALSVFRRDGFYRLGEALVNVGHGVVYQVWDSFTKVLVMAPFLWLSGLVGWAVLPLDSVWAWVAGIIVYDFVSYWAHRHHHEVNLLWAIHGVHHAAEDFNLAAGLRQATFQNVFKWAWKLPLALVMPVQMFIGIIVFDFLYQFLQHTRYVGKLGPVEWVFNTPSHHRVHHGRQPKYIDKNYGGILIVWDRLFGTFQEEEETPEFGVTKPLHTLNVIWANLAFYDRLVDATRRARGWDRVRLWFAGPADVERFAPGEPSPSPAAPPSATPGRRLQTYVLLTAFTIPPLLGGLLLFGDAWSTGARLATGAFVVVSVVSACGLFERRWWALPLEITRWMAAAVGLVWALGVAA